ncbi:hypothetical protein AMTRI_Chr12g241090 [Amborella trichopoda]
MEKQWEWNTRLKFSLMFISSFLVAMTIVLMSMDQVELHSLIDAGRSAFFTFANPNPSSISPNSNSTSSSCPCDPPKKFTEKTNFPAPKFRMLMGILTRPGSYNGRNLLRLAYSTQTTNVAEIDVKFVICNVTDGNDRVIVALEIMKFNDIIILQCSENMDKGKTYTYFSSLPEMLSQPYDYVMKTDDDMYFRLDVLARSLDPLPRTDFYYGRVIPCKSTDPFFGYMGGMGYILSWDLVEWIGISNITRNHAEGFEDKLVSEWFNEGNRAKNRFTATPRMYDVPGLTTCSHEYMPDTIGVHRLKNKRTWAQVLRYFNVTDGVKPSKMYHLL